MAVPTGCRIAFSFTAFFSTSYTVWYAVMHRLPWLTRAGHGITAIITAGLAVVSAYSLKSHSAVLDRVSISLLCAGIGTSPFVKLTILNQRVKLPYALICIILARILVLLTVAISAVLLVGYNAEALSSIVLLSVALQYASFGSVVLLQYKRTKKEPHYLPIRVVQQLHSWSITSGSFVCAVLGFSFQDMDLINWSLWALFLLVLLPEGLLLAYKTIRQAVDGLYPGDINELESLGGQDNSEKQAHIANSQSLSPSNSGCNGHDDEESLVNDTRSQFKEVAQGLSIGTVDQLDTMLHEQKLESVGAQRV